MGRKLEAIVNDWTQTIVLTERTYEDLTTLTVCKAAGGIVRGLRDAHEQIAEINSALDALVADGYLDKKDVEPKSEFYIGITFKSYTYTATDNFQKLVVALQTQDRPPTPVPSTIYNIHDNSGQMSILSTGVTMNQINSGEGLDEDIKALIEELRVAMEKKDKSAIKKVFGYIVDKSVDVAIQIALGKFYHS